MVILDLCSFLRDLRVHETHVNITKSNVLIPTSARLSKSLLNYLKVGIIVVESKSVL